MFGSGGVRVRRIVAIAHRRENSRLVCSAAQGYVLGFVVGVLHGEFAAGSAGDLGAAFGVVLLVVAMPAQQAEVVQVGGAADLAGPDREALAVSVLTPVGAGLGCSAAEGSVFGGSSPSPIAARIPGWCVQQRRGMCWGLLSGCCMVSSPRGPRVISAPRLEWISLWWQCPHSKQRLSRSVGPPSFQLQM